MTFGAVAILEIKSYDVEQRIIRGIASTPEPDRSGDIVEPLGLTFNNPIPLFLHHDRTKPVGLATLGPVTPDGVLFEAVIPRIDEPGVLKDRVDEAWHSIKAGILRGISMGFTAARATIERLKSGGRRFVQSEVLELSLVAVPANASASILTIKSLVASDRPSLPAVAGTARSRGNPMTTAEQITSFTTTRKNKSDRMTEMMTAAAADNVTLDEKETDEYDTLSTEIKSIDAHIVRLQDLEKFQTKTATPITPTTSSDDASKQRSGVTVLQVKANVPKATAFVRYAMALCASRGNYSDAVQFAKRWEESTPEVALVLKAAVAAGTTTDATWAAPLVPTLQPLASEFLELLRPATIIGRIPNLRRVPFNVAVPAQTSGGTYGWVGQGAAKPVTKLGFGTVTIGIAKAAGIIVLTEELVRLSSPSAEETCRADMIAGIAQFLDQQFVDPAVAEVANISPASITNGTVAIPSSGATPDNARTDIKALINSFVAANLSTANAVLLMSETNAFSMGTALNPLGQSLFPGLGTSGGSTMGIPVVTSSVMGSNIVLVDARGVLYADDGGVNLDVSREASLQMDSAPDNPAVATTVHISLWQQNLVGLRAERFINWKRARLQSVKYVSGANYA